VSTQSTQSPLLVDRPITRRDLGLAKASQTYPIYMRPVTVDPPAAAEPFVWNNAIEMPAVGASEAIISFVVPPNRSGVIWRVGNATGLGGGIAQWVNGSGDLIWQVLRNGSPFKNMNDIRAAIGLVEQMGGLLSAPLRLRANDTITLVVFNIAVPAAGQNLVGLLGGWYYPASQDPPTLR